AGKAEVHRKPVCGLDHTAQMEWPRRAGGGKGAVRRAGTAAEHRGNARHQSFLDLLRTNEMDVCVKAAGGEDLAFTGDYFGSGPDDNRNSGLDIGIAGLADRGDAVALDADVGFDNAPMVENQRVGDDRID